MTKEFLIKSLLPYKNDPSLCGYNYGNCVYLTEDNKKCAIGQYMKKGYWQSSIERVNTLLSTDNKIKKYMKAEWCKQNIPHDVATYMQYYHDHIANNNSKISINNIVDKLENITGFDLNELKYTILNIQFKI